MVTYEIVGYVFHLFLKKYPELIELLCGILE